MSKKTQWRPFNIMILHHFRQHQKQYLPLDREILLDIVAYCPTIAGVQKDTPPKKISKVMGKLYNIIPQFI
jgi:hypothetical protein